MPHQTILEHSIFDPAVPLNRDAKERHQYNVRVLEALSAPSSSWTERETTLLQDVLRAQLQEDMFRRCLAVMSEASAEAKVAEFLKLCSEAGEATLHDMMQQQGDMVDWISVSEKLRVAEGSRPRSTVSCLVHYKHFVEQGVSQAPFSEEEDSSVREIVQRRGACNWETIASELGTQRTAWQCFSRYKTCLAPDEHRCTKRKSESTHPYGRSSVWTPEKERRLTLARQVYGDSDWSLVARHVPGHSPDECRRHAGGYSRSGLPWTEEEDRKLLSATKRHGANWLQVSLRTLGRPRCAIQRRILRLQADSKESMKSRGAPSKGHRRGKLIQEARRRLRKIRH
jgi:myb proto-oncogene protein